MSSIPFAIESIPATLYGETARLTAGKVFAQSFSSYMEMHAAMLGAMAVVVFLVLYSISERIGAAYLGGVALVALVPDLAHQAIAGEPYYFFGGLVLGLVVWVPFRVRHDAFLGRHDPGVAPRDAAGGSN